MYADRITQALSKSLGARDRSWMVPWKTRAVVLVGVGAPLGMIADADPAAADEFLGTGFFPADDSSLTVEDSALDSWGGAASWSSEPAAFSTNVANAALGSFDEVALGSGFAFDTDPPIGPESSGSPMAEKLDAVGDFVAVEKTVLVSFASNIDGQDFQRDLTALQGEAGFVVGGSVDEASLDSGLELSWQKVQALPEAEKSAYLVAGDRSEHLGELQPLAVLSGMPGESPAAVGNSMSTADDLHLGSFEDAALGSGFVSTAGTHVGFDGPAADVVEESVLVSFAPKLDGENFEREVPPPPSGGLLKATHTILAGGGLVLWVGVIPDGLDAALYGIEGLATGDEEKFVQMGISIGAMVPLAGQGVGITRLGAQFLPNLAAKAPRSAAIRTSEQVATGTLVVGLGAAAKTKLEVDDDRSTTPGFESQDVDPTAGALRGRSSTPIELFDDTGLSAPIPAPSFAPGGFQTADPLDLVVSQPDVGRGDWRDQIMASSSGSSDGSGPGAHEHAASKDSGQGATGASDQQQLSEAELDDLTLEDLDGQLVLAEANLAERRTEQNKAFDLHSRRWVGMHRERLFQAGDQTVAAEAWFNTVKQVRSRKAQETDSASERSTDSVPVGSEASRYDAAQVAELWDAYKAAASDHAEHRRLQRFAFAKIGEGVRGVQSGALDEMPPEPYDLYVERTDAARNRMEDLEQRYRATLTGVEETTATETGASFTFSESELWEKFQADYQTVQQLGLQRRAALDETIRAELERDEEEAWHQLLVTESGLERALGSFPFRPALRETVQDGARALVVKTGEGTVVKLFRSQRDLRVFPRFREIVRNEGDDTFGRETALANDWDFAIAEEERNREELSSLADLHNDLREGLLDSNGNEIGHLIPEHRMRSDFPDALEIEEVPMGQPGYLRAKDLTSEVYVEAFENLLPVFKGVESRGVSTDFTPRNVTFDEHGRVTSFFDLEPGFRNEPATLPDDSTLRLVLAQYFSNFPDGGSSHLKAALFESLGLVNENGKLNHEALGSALDSFVDPSY